MPIGLVERGEAGELEHRVLGFADDHRVHVGRTLHRGGRRRRRVRPEAHERRAEGRFQLPRLGDIGVERRRGAAEHEQRRLVAVGFEAVDELPGGQPLGRLVDQAEINALLAQDRGEHRERVGWLGRAEHFLALLAAALAGERHAVDERRIEQQDPAAERLGQRLQPFYSSPDSRGTPNA